MRDKEKEKSMSYIKNADIQGNAWVAPGACVVGNVTLGDESSVWYNAVLRGDMAPIVVGCGSNVQDGTVVHAEMASHVKSGMEHLLVIMRLFMDAQSGIIPSLEWVRLL